MVAALLIVVFLVSLFLINDNSKIEETINNPYEETLSVGWKTNDSLYLILKNEGDVVIQGGWNAPIFFISTTTIKDDIEICYETIYVKMASYQGLRTIFKIEVGETIELWMGDQIDFDEIIINVTLI